MATWKKVIVSGSTADLANVQNAGIASNQVVVGGGAGANQVGKALTAGQILMGNASAVPTGTSVSGDATLSNAGVLSIANDKVTSTMLSGSIADTPTTGDLVKVGENGAFTFSPAASTLSAGEGISIPANNKISASVDDSTLEINGSNQLQVKDAGIGLAKLANAAANTVIVRDANSSGVLSAKAVTDQQILIGDGTGFTAASLSGEATMTNTGVVSLANNIGGANTRVTGSINQIKTAAGTDTTAFVTFVGDAASETNAVLTSTGLTANMTRNSISATEFTGSLKGDVQGNADTATTAATANALSTNATGNNLTLSGNLIVNGTTTEVRTDNLNIEDKFILLQSGSATAAAGDSGIIFGGISATPTGDVAASGQGSALFVDKELQRLSLSNGYVNAGDTAATVGAHIPLVTTGSLSAVAQVGNFKVDASGDLFVYAG